MYERARGTDHVEAVEVVHVAVLPGPVHRVLVHGDLGPVEDGRLVHVVPGVQVLHGALSGEGGGVVI